MRRHHDILLDPLVVAFFFGVFAIMVFSLELNLIQWLKWIIPCVVFVVFLLCCVIAYNRLALDTHGSASWISWFVKIGIVNKRNDGYVIDGVTRIKHQLSTQNIITVAPTGAGKTWGQIIPNILRQKEYSIVVTDPSGEVFDATAAGMQAEGIDIYVFRPMQPNNTMFYNPLGHIENLSDAKVIADNIMAQQDSNDKFWVNSPSVLISALIHLLVDMSEKTQVNQKNMANLMNLLTLKHDELCLLIQEFGSVSTKTDFCSYREAGSNTKSSILASALSALSLYSDPKIQQSTSHNAIDFANLRRKKSVLYLIVPEDKLPYCRSLLALFYSHLFSYLFNNTKGFPVYLLLDEFGNMKIPEFDTIITQARKKNMSISLMLQSLEQLQSKYPKGFKTIFDGGCQTKIFYPGMGLGCCNTLSETMGEKTIVSKAATAKTGVPIGRRLMCAEEIRTMPKGNIVVLTENNKPMKLQIKLANEQKELQGFMDYYDDKHVKINNIISDKGRTSPLIYEGG